MNTDKIYAESIANEYSVKKFSKVVKLKKLDRKVKNFPTIFAFTFGIISALIMGTGMSLCLGSISLGSTVVTMVVGIILGVVGISGASVNYPIYKKLLNNRKEKYSGDIINLAKEITEEENN